MKKYLALFLCLVTVVSLFAGCGSSADGEIVLPKQVVEETYENRQKAMLETAKAYYYHNPYIQYGNDGLTVTGNKFGVRNAEWMNNTPEMAGPQRSTYLVCSYYTYGISYHALDCKLLDSWTQCSAVKLGQATAKSLQPYIVWHYTSNGNEAEDLAAMEEFFSTVQVGDVVSYERKHNSVGHAAMWAGDVDNDGDPDILNVDGKPFDSTTGEDIREEEGAVRINYSRADSATWYFGNPDAYDYFPKLKEVTILRPADMKHAEYNPITERAKTRILFPDMAIFFEAEDGIYGSVPAGGEYTFTLTVKNHSQQDYEGLLVQLPVPENAEIVKVMGAAKKNKVVKLKLNVPAGQEVAVDYTVKATGSVGDVIQTGVGYVHAIPLPSLNVAITSADTDASAVKAAMEANKGKNGEEFLAGYLASMGYDAEITADAVQKAAYDRKNMGEYKVLMPKAAADVAEEDKALYKMLIPEFYGGKHILSESASSLRAKEIRAQDLQAGDILIWQKDLTKEPMVAIHNGDGLICAKDGQLKELWQFELDAMFLYRYFFALRPTQAL